MHSAPNSFSAAGSERIWLLSPIQTDGCFLWLAWTISEMIHKISQSCEIVTARGLRGPGIRWWRRTSNVDFFGFQCFYSCLSITSSHVALMRSKHGVYVCACVYVKHQVLHCAFSNRIKTLKSRTWKFESPFESPFFSGWFKLNHPEKLNHRMIFLRLYFITLGRAISSCILVQYSCFKRDKMIFQIRNYCVIMIYFGHIYTLYSELDVEYSNLVHIILVNTFIKCSSRFCRIFPSIWQASTIWWQDSRIRESDIF